MKTILAVALTVTLLYSCSPNVAKIDNGLKKYFDSSSVEGTFAMLNNQRGDVTVYNLGMDTQRVSPGTIFKIAEVLIGVESSRLTDKNSTLNTADSSLGKVTLQSAFDQNNTEFFRELAIKIGKDTLSQWIDTLKYGNMNVADTTGFWNDGQLIISPDEQLGFMSKIYFNKLPFEKYAQQLIKDLLLKEDNTLYRMSYTTGSAMSVNKEPMAWITGWIEENRHVYFFVSLIKSKENRDDLEKTATNITKNILAAKGFFKGQK